MRHRQADNPLGVSSANSIISKAMSSRKPVKPQTSKNPTRIMSATPNTSASSSTASPTTSKGKRNRKAPDYYGFESSVCSVSDPETMPAPKRPKPNNVSIEKVMQEEALQPPAVETSFELPIVSPPDPRIRPIGTSPTEHTIMLNMKGKSVGAFLMTKLKKTIKLFQRYIQLILNSSVLIFIISSLISEL